MSSSDDTPPSSAHQIITQLHLPKHLCMETLHPHNLINKFIYHNLNKKFIYFYTAYLTVQHIFILIKLIKNNNGFFFLQICNKNMWWQHGELTVHCKTFRRWTVSSNMETRKAKTWRFGQRKEKKITVWLCPLSVTLRVEVDMTVRPSYHIMHLPGKSRREEKTLLFFPKRLKTPRKLRSPIIIWWNIIPSRSLTEQPITLTWNSASGMDLDGYLINPCQPPLLTSLFFFFFFSSKW